VSPPSRLADFLERHATIGIDTSPFIYYLEGDARYASTTVVLFTRIEAGQTKAVTSTITMLELLVRPMRDGRATLVNDINALGSRYPNLEWAPTSLAIATRAAHLRAHHHLATPDAIQIATALESGATGFVTNDRQLLRVTELDVLVLDDVLS
jgi:predicted nucleic acid-binding protein